MHGKACPTCGYIRQVNEDAPEDQCPDCGANYARAEAQLERERRNPRRKKNFKPRDPSAPPDRKPENGLMGLLAFVVIMVVLFVLRPDGASKSYSTAHAAPSNNAEELMAEARKFCRTTPTGQSYKSEAACMEYQAEGIKSMQRAIQSGGQDQQIKDCIAGARYEGPVDFAAAALCARVLK